MTQKSHLEQKLYVTGLLSLAALMERKDDIEKKKINQAKYDRAGEFSSPNYCKSGPALSAQRKEVKTSGRQELLPFNCPKQ